MILVPTVLIAADFWIIFMKMEYNLCGTRSADTGYGVSYPVEISIKISGVQKYIWHDETETASARNVTTEITVEDQLGVNVESIADRLEMMIPLATLPGRCNNKAVCRIVNGLRSELNDRIDDRLHRDEITLEQSFECVKTVTDTLGITYDIVDRLLLERDIFEFMRYLPRIADRWERRVLDGDSDRGYTVEWVDSLD